MNLPRSVFKLVAFVLVCGLSAVLVLNTLNDPLPGEKAAYHAVFSNAEGLEPGSEVRVAGVRVGTVDTVALVDGKARVSFRVRTGQHVPSNVRAVIQYADLLGARYLALERADNDGKVNQAAVRNLEPGSTIPDTHTTPALELTALLNGFKPLFDTIDPGEVNKLARQIVGALQGEGSTLTSLLRHVVTLTSTLNDKDAVLTDVIANLNSVLTTMTGHSDDIKRLVNALGELAGSVADNRDLIADALDSGSKLAASLVELLDGLAPNISGSVHALKQVSGTLVRNQRQLAETLGRAPEFLRTMNRALDYGSWVNVYVCSLDVRIAGEPLELSTGPHSKVCR